MTMKLKTLSLYTALVGTLFSSAALAEIVVDTTATATIDLSLNIGNRCHISGLDSTQNKAIDASTGQLIIPGIKAACNSTTRPKISFASTNGDPKEDKKEGNYKLKSTTSTTLLGYTVKLGDTALDPMHESEIPTTPKDLTIKVSDANFADNPPGSYTDILTATVTL